MMYVCLDCEEEFDEPVRITETHGLERPIYEHFYVCPHCLSSDYTRARYCDCCNNVILGDYVWVDSLAKIICEDCYEKGSMY